jgi:hypothetical protein
MRKGGDADRDRAMKGATMYKCAGIAAIAIMCVAGQGMGQTDSVALPETQWVIATPEEAQQNRNADEPMFPITKADAQQQTLHLGLTRWTIDALAAREGRPGMTQIFTEHAWMADPTEVPSTDERADAMALMAPVPGSDLETLGRYFDVAESDRPWSATTSVHLLGNTGLGSGQWVPFASVAREVAMSDEEERLGYGGGLSYYTTDKMSIGTELLYFGSRGDSNDAFEKESRMMLQLQWEF